MENTKKDANTWHSETVHPDIVCKDCVHRNGGGLEYPGPTKGSCEIYAYPDSKPYEVYFQGAKCLYYKKEEPKK